MGATTSAPVAAPSLDSLEPDDQRNLLRNVQSVAGRDQRQPGKFEAAAFREIHASMPPQLADGLWRGLCAASRAPPPLDLDAVLRTVVPLRVGPTAASQRAHIDACFSDSAERAIAVAFEEAAPWLESMGEELPVDASALAIRSLGTAQALLAAAACAVWTLDLRDAQPLPVLAEGTSRLLTTAHVRALSAMLPVDQRRRWRLLFTTCRDGCSFTRLVGHVAERTPCLLVVRDRAGATFGAFAAAPLRKGPAFGGAYGSFLFTLVPAVTVHRASGASANLVYLNAGAEQLPNGLAFGGNLDARYFGLWLRDDLESGRSDGPCATYGDAPCLASAAEFVLDELEVWAVEEDPPPPSEEEQAAARGENALTAAGVLDAKHQETRNFLALATGKGQHADSLAPIE